MAVSLKDPPFSAVGDGVVDDTVAVQAWVNYLSANALLGFVPKGNYKLTDTITAPQANFWGWYGEGPYISTFFYAGSNLTKNILDFGGSGGDSRGCSFRGFSVFSFVTMSGGTSLKLTNFTRAILDDLTVGGELYAPNTWDGLWFNGCHENVVDHFDCSNHQHDGIIVNAGNLGNSSNSDLGLVTGSVNRCGNVSIRCAGGFGGLYIGQVQTLGSTNAHLLVDNSISAATNREIIIGAEYVADGVHSTTDNIVLNAPSSSHANITIAGFLGSAARYTLNAISWPNGFVNFSAGRIFNNLSDAIFVGDATMTLICGSGVSIDSNTGYAVNSSVTNQKAQIRASFFDNNPAGGGRDIAPNIGGWDTSFTPTITSGAGSLASASGTMRYDIRGKTVSFRALATIATNGTGAGNIKITLPIPAVVSSITAGRATVSGKALQGFISGSDLLVVNYDNSYPGANGESLLVAGVYEAA